MSQRYPRHSAEQWSDLVAEFNRSNETVQAFCTRHQLGFSTFNKWRRRFSPALPNDPVAASSRSSFVQAVSVEDVAAGITLHVGESVRLVLPCTIGVDIIADLAHAVASRVRD